MNRWKLLALGLLGAALGAAAWRMRPIAPAAAQVTALAPGAPPVAHVALAYGPGMLPVHVVIDLIDREGRVVGSLTAPGGRLLLEAPVNAGAGELRARVTAYHRFPWGVRAATREF